MAFFRRYDIEPIDPSEVPVVVSETYVGQCIQVAVVTVFAYDIVTTMDKEVKYFWKGAWKSVDIVYFANRYIGLFGAISSLSWNAYGVKLVTCYFSTWSLIIANSITIVLIDYILMIRVLALYSNSRLLSICLKILLLLEAIVRFGMSFYAVSYEKPVVGGLANNITVCGVDRYPPWYWGTLDWTLPLLYAVILLILALYKAAEYWRLSAGFKGFKLVKVLVQDQVFYFSIVLLCSAAEIISLVTQESNEFLTNLLLALGSPAFLCILGSRLLVNLKEAGELGLNEGTNYRPDSQSVSDINFADGNVEVSDNGV